MIWKTTNDVVFRDEVLSIQKLMFSLINLLWLEAKLFIENGLTTLAQFIHWMGVS